MNDDAHEPGFDCLLVLLPGSTAAPEGIQLLCRLSGFDHFIIENKLKIKLPHILCPVLSHEIAGSSGDLLETSGINFLVVRKTFLDLQFQPFMVVSCRFGEKKSRFSDSARHFVDIFNEENILLIEGSYQTTDGKVSYMMVDDAGSGEGRKKPKTVFTRDLKICRFVMLYQAMDPNPLVFIDRVMDYSFLESLKKMTVSANFKVLKDALEETFRSPVDQKMLRHGYVLEEVRHVIEQKAKGFKLKSSQETITTAISNEAAANRMSRLMFFQWCKDKGWVYRIMPGV